MQTLKEQSKIEILERGWNTLVENLGPVNASYFIQSFPRGKGSSVSFWRNFWGKKTVKEIDDEIRKAKLQGEI
jgi:hypothetical protein